MQHILTAFRFNWLGSYNNKLYLCHAKKIKQ